MKRCLVWLPVVGALFGSSPRPAAQSAPVVTPPAGTLRGAVAGDIRVFKGIPYAVPPTGPLRWKPPVPAARWNDTRDATEFGPVCMTGAELAIDGGYLAQ